VPLRSIVPVWMDAWLGTQPSEALWRIPQVILEASTPSFLYQRSSRALC
jgi:hypothetical protein